MILSVDPGEKNFAFCLGDPDNVVEWRNVNVVRKKGQTVVESCVAISETLSEYVDVIGLCTHVVIEQQMRTNVRASRIGQHVWSWCLGKFPDVKVVYYPASKKTQAFIGKNDLGPKERKKWSVDHVTRLLANGAGGPRASSLFSSIEGKRDDVADTYLQLAAFCAEVKVKEAKAKEAATAVKVKASNTKLKKKESCRAPKLESCQCPSEDNI